MWSISQTKDGWAVVHGDTTITTCATQALAVAALGRLVSAVLAGTGEAATPVDMPGVGIYEYAGDPTGMLPERWRGTIAYNAVTESDGRDFTKCVWSWRDPATYPLPLMLETENEPGHGGACWGGTMDSVVLDASGNVVAGGGFMDTEDGRKARDMLVAAKRLGVSCDPGAVEWEDTCTAVDADGFCVDGFTSFLAYEIIGLTITPFPAFAQAFIELDTAEPVASEPGAAVPVEAVAAASAPARPPRAWFDDPQFDAVTPLTITDDGRVLGFVADFSTCHVGHQARCVTAPGDIALSFIHTGTVVCADGESVATGPLVWHADHAPLNLAAAAAVDHYAHTGLAWADVRFGVNDLGVWCAGAVRPDCMDDVTLRSLRASALSGDWRRIDGRLQLCAVLTVNSPGFPIPRALAASGAPHSHEGETRVRWRDEALVAAVGLGRVAQPCATCGDHAEREDALVEMLRAVQETLRVYGVVLANLDVRTRPLIAQARAEARLALEQRLVGRPAPDAMPTLAAIRRR